MARNQTNDRNQKRSPNPPKLIAYHVADSGRGRKFWTRLGGVWEHKNGEGLTVFVNVLPIDFDGRIVLLPPRDDEDSQVDDGEAAESEAAMEGNEIPF
jgi:hypothetical protein